jgi:cobalt-zinc-cadmium efflux system membrane fusion protein
MKRSQPTVRILASAVVLAILTLLLACNSASSNGESKQASDLNTPALFSIPQDQAAHVQVMMVTPATLTRSLRLTGSVAYNNFHSTPVITQVGGPISRIVALPGQKVRRYEPLAYVASPDYSQLRSSYMKAKDNSSLAAKSYARAQDLYQHHAIAQRDLEAAESAKVQAEADVSSAAAALKVMGIADPDALIAKPSSPEVPVLAPISGEIVEQLISPGQVIQAGVTQCFTISDMSNVWVLVNVYQKDLPYIRVGDPVEISTDSYPDVFHGKISYIAAALDPNTRTLQARIETANPGEKLKKDMYVTASVNAGETRNAIAVPDTAVLRDAENEPFVYAEQSPNQFGRRSVKLGDSQKGQTQITDGLKPGDRIVADGSLFLQFANSAQR